MIYACVNKQFELLEFVFNSVYVGLKYNSILKILLLLGMCACVMGVVMWLSLFVCEVVLVPYGDAVNVM